MSAIEDALGPLRAMLSADGYDLEIREASAERVVAEIKAGAEACADCLVPKDIMQVYFTSALSASLGGEPPTISLVYPSDPR